MEYAGGKLKSELLTPLLSRLRRSLEHAGVADENTLYIMEEELGDLLLEPARGNISEIVRKLVTGHAVDAATELGTVFETAAIKSQLLTFFSDFAIGDLFAELYELACNALDPDGRSPSRASIPGPLPFVSPMSVPHPAASTRARSALPALALSRIPWPAR
jgi:hypothetical protein